MKPLNDLGFKPADEGCPITPFESKSIDSLNEKKSTYSIVKDRISNTRKYAENKLKSTVNVITSPFNNTLKTAVYYFNSTFKTAKIAYFHLFPPPRE
jgi:hypothetical protein